MGTLVLGPLQSLGRDPRVTDVAVTCDGRVWVDSGEGMQEREPDIPFRSPQVLRDYAVQLCAQLGRRLDDAMPIADAADPSGVRVHAVIAPLVPQGAAISIRFPDRGGVGLEDLGRGGLFPPQWLPVLVGLVRGRGTLLITGGTGAGKTTLLKALLGCCDDAERIVAVEEVRELGGLRHGNMVSLTTREANVEGAGAVGLPDLVKATLRMRPDRVILGECRGEEVVDLLRAYNSGHRGGMTTLHADRVGRVPARLVSLGLLAGLAPQALAALAEGAFDAILHLERRRGRRVLSQIGRLAVADGGFRGDALAVWDGVGPPRHAPEWQDFSARWAGIVPIGDVPTGAVPTCAVSACAVPSGDDGASVSPVRTIPQTRRLAIPARAPAPPADGRRDCGRNRGREHGGGAGRSPARGGVPS